MEWFTSLSDGAQVAIISGVFGLLGAVVVGITTFIKIRLSEPKEEESHNPLEDIVEVITTTKPHTMALSETDQLRLDRLIFVVDSLGSTLERLRVQISLIK